jgi:hypothetical protein
MNPPHSQQEDRWAEECHQCSKQTLVVATRILSGSSFRGVPQCASTPVFSVHPNLESEAVVSKLKPGQIMDDLRKKGPGLMDKAFEYFARPSSHSRRNFMAACGATSLGVLLAKGAEAATVGPLSAAARRDRAKQIRVDQADANAVATGASLQPTNGDEELYSNKIGNYSKGLPHNASDGTVVLAAYSAMVHALSTAAPADFELIPLGGDRKLTNPQAGYAFEMEGRDGPSLLVPPPPKFASREQAAEIAENYWMALLRDVPFARYPTHPIANKAAQDLTSYGADAKVPKNASGQVTPDLLFRGFTPGDRVGPYLSQFFYLPCPFGANFLEQRVFHPVAARDFGNLSFEDFVSIQNGVSPGRFSFETTIRYMRNGRGIGEWVHVDVLFQAYFMAFLSLASQRVPLDTNNPYRTSQTQIGFATFGGPHIATLLCEVSTRALHATWYQKWFAHRRLRPEAFAGAIEARLRRGANFDIHPAILDDLQTAGRLGDFFAASALLPLAFPEGSPTHPSYTAGHATVAGACATILKAFFDEQAPVPLASTPSDDGLSIVGYTGPTLTVGGELNKVASNVANGRNLAGVHWRSDSTSSLLLGEQIAIQLMREHNETFNESFQGLQLTKFDGTTILV